MRAIKAVTGGTFRRNPVDVDWRYLETVARDSKREAQSDRKKKHVIVKPTVSCMESARIARLEKEKAELEQKLSALQGLGG